MTSIKFPVTYTDGKHGFLFIDPSAAHLGWTLVQLDLDKKELYISAVGMLWTKDSWTKAKRYRYMLDAASILVDGNAEVTPQVLVTESFFMNPKLPMGSAVVPTINALLSMAAEEKEVMYQELGPSAWRGILNIKSRTVAGKRDFKGPTADVVRKDITLPSTIPSNVNRKDRLMPHDITDVLAIALAVAKHHGITKVVTGNTAFYPIDMVEKLNKLSEKVK